MDAGHQPAAEVRRQAAGGHGDRPSPASSSRAEWKLKLREGRKLLKVVKRGSHSGKEDLCL